MYNGVSELIFLVERVNIFLTLFIWCCHKEYNNTKQCINFIGFLQIRSSVRICKCESAVVWNTLYPSTKMFNLSVKNMQRCGSFVVYFV